MLTIDPSQKKIVIALMAVLIGAICVTAARMVPSGPLEPAEKSESARPVAADRNQARVQVRDISRNPFTPPVAFQAVEAQGSAGENGRLPGEAGSRTRIEAVQQANDDFSVQPMNLDMPFKAASSPNTAQQGTAGSPKAIEKAKPTFVLLATIKCAEGLSAVIQTGDAKTRVVNVGDVLECGYRVKLLEPGRAVLTDGRDTIIAKRPRS